MPFNRYVNTALIKTKLLKSLLQKQDLAKMRLRAKIFPYLPPLPVFYSNFA